MQSRLGFLGLTLLLTALLAACTAPAAPTSTPPPPKAAVTAMPTVPATASTTTAPAAKPTEAPATTAAAAAIKVGYLSILTGSLAAPGADMRDGFLMYLQEKQNSLAGRKVEVIVDDTEGKADVALTKAKKQVERDKVNMLAGVTSSAEAAALSDYIVSNKIPMLITNAGDDPLTQVKSSPYIYRVSFSNSQATHPMGAWAYKK
ncbi:MAG: ABC transporter substrate-binding protein, partial [Dehalococcoidia bacterium]|nr:ABC transporter substrate-binding protein [Dehalococcoidia bacterium]